MRAFALIAFLIAPLLAIATPVDTTTNAPTDRIEEECRRDADPHYHRLDRGCRGMS